MTFRRTIALHVCSWCRRIKGVSLWPWNPQDGWITETSTMCDACAAKMLADEALAALEG